MTSWATRPNPSDTAPSTARPRSPRSHCMVLTAPLLYARTSGSRRVGPEGPLQGRPPRSPRLTRLTADGHEAGLVMDHGNHVLHRIISCGSGTPHVGSPSPLLLTPLPRSDTVARTSINDLGGITHAHRYGQARVADGRRRGGADRAR